MRQIIKNSAALATTPARADTLAIIEAGLAAIDTDTVIREELRVTDDILTVDGRDYILTDYEHIYIIGFGKVSCTAARTLETILAGHVREGAVVGVKDQVCEVVDTYVGTHPLPTSINYAATKHIEAIARQATERDLVLVIVSGGGSALLCSSMGECEQGAELFRSFLPSGGTIEELNTVRKHISTLKGGGLAAALYPANVISLVFSDVPGDELSAVASGPTYYDETTVADAEAIIKRYQLGDFTLVETPKDKAIFSNIHNIALVSNQRALAVMQTAADSLGYQTNIFSHTHYATPAETAAIVARETTPGTVVLFGGETRLSVPENCKGKGGRNDYLALHVLPNLSPQQVFAAVASDGHDNTDAAGAVVDSSTNAAVKQQALKLDTYTECLNSYPFFQAVGGHIMTGQLSSNVSDLMVLLNAKTVTAPAAVHTKEPAAITDLAATVVNDSRGKPTIAVTLRAGSTQASFSVPSGASTGSAEVVALPAKAAITMLNRTIKPALLGMAVTDQAAIDARLHELDTSLEFSTLGGNTALGVSVAATKVAAQTQELATWQYIEQLFATAPQAKAPRLFVNLINGGAHAKYGSPIQEHQIIPETDNPHEAFRLACAVQRALRDVLRTQYSEPDITIGDEGGFVIPSTTIEEPFQLILRAIAEAKVSCPVSLGTDIAASSFAAPEGYELLGSHYTTAALLDRWRLLCSDFPNLQYIEDPCAELDWEGFAAAQAQATDRVVIGDDLTTSNAKTLARAIEAQAITGIIIKPNQIGTVSDTLATMRLAYQHNIRCIVSHRSGETMDDFIADLAYGTKAFGLKAGAPTAKERLVKYQRLLDITA